ncbi:MAG: family 16 glycoside hydrolase [Candidatus Brocadiaceae bacterium]
MYKVFIRQFYWLFLAIAVIALSAIVSSHTYGAVKFSDYFTDGDDAGWAQLNRDWSLTLGRYVLDGDYKPDNIERGGWTVTHAGDKKWRNYQLSATFDNTNAPGKPSPDVHSAEFLVRVKESGVPGVNGTFYRIAVWPIGTTDPRGGGGTIANGLVQISKIVKGSQVEYVDKESSNTAVGTNAIIIKVDGDKIQITINGNKILTWKDKSKPILYGGIGLGAIWEAEAWFDNVIVSTP